MDKKPIVSVIVLTYNQKNLIRHTIDSILEQKTTFSFEIIIADDHSTDGTWEVIKKYIETKPQIIKGIENPQNLGVVKSYFNAVSQSNGIYVMTCAGDDWWLPHKIQTQVDHMKNEKDCGMIYGKAIMYYHTINKLTKETIGEKSETFSELLFHNHVTAVTACIKKTELLKYIEEVKPESHVWLMEDYPIWLWFSIRSKVKFYDETLAVYRYVEDSISHSSDINKKLKFEESVYDVQKFYLNIFQMNIEEADTFHYKRLAQIYLEFNNMKNYRKFLKKSNDSNKTVKILVSYLPKYKELLKVRHKLICRMKSEK